MILVARVSRNPTKRAKTSIAPSIPCSLVPTKNGVEVWHKGAMLAQLDCPQITKHTLGTVSTALGVTIIELAERATKNGLAQDSSHA